MKPRSILILSLLTVFVLAACAPAATPAPAQAEPTIALIPQEPEPLVAATETQPTQNDVPPAEAPTDVPQAVATSRGPDLEATDPASVSLASGELQLVEFFRFT
jgi:hypothetical protein